MRALSSILCALGALAIACPALAAEATFGESDGPAPMLAGSQSLVGWLVILPVVLPLVGSALTLTLRSMTHVQLPIAIVAMAGAVLSAAGLFAEVNANGPLMMAMGDWRPPFGIVFTVDALGAVLVFVTALVGLVGLGYARSEIDEKGVKYGFYSFYLLMIAGVGGAFSTGDLFNLYVWFEVFLVSSFGLLILGGTRIQLDGAVKYGVLNLIATTMFLVAVGALYGATGTLNMADLRQVLSIEHKAPLYTVGALFLLAFAMKAASFPLHFWLPASYHTPRVIVSALFAGLLTKVGIYSLMRVLVMMFGVEGAAMMPIVGVLGILTAVLGALGALAQDELKRIASFIVVSGIGVMMIGLGLGTAAGLTGAIVYAVHSILAMTGLFLILGVAERLGATGSLWKPGGLYSAAGFAAGLFLVFGFAAAGLPPFSGFWPKLMLVEASLAVDGWLAVPAAVGVILSGFLTTIVVGRAWTLVFLRPRSQETEAAAVPAGRVEPSVVMFAAFVIALGLFPALVIEPATQGAAGLLDPTLYIERVLKVN